MREPEEDLEIPEHIEDALAEVTSAQESLFNAKLSLEQALANAGEWGRGEFHTNTIEGFFSIFKRGMKGVYQHCAKKHLHRYAGEFEFRYNHRVALGFSDSARASRALKGIKGKRLTYRQSPSR